MKNVIGFVLLGLGVVLMVMGFTGNSIKSATTTDEKIKAVNSTNILLSGAVIASIGGAIFAIGK